MKKLYQPILISALLLLSGYARSAQTEDTTPQPYNRLEIKTFEDTIPTFAKMQNPSYWEEHAQELQTRPEEQINTPEECAQKLQTRLEEQIKTSETKPWFANINKLDQITQSVVAVSTPGFFRVKVVCYALASICIANPANALVEEVMNSPEQLKINLRMVPAVLDEDDIYAKYL